LPFDDGADVYYQIHRNEPIDENTVSIQVDNHAKIKEIELYENKIRRILSDMKDIRNFGEIKDDKWNEWEDFDKQ
jgi:hypothetical protein